MLHTKFPGHWSIGFGEEDFLRFFTIYGHGGHVGHVTQLICINFHSYSPSSFHMLRVKYILLTRAPHAGANALL